MIRRTGAILSILPILSISRDSCVLQHRLAGILAQSIREERVKPLISSPNSPDGIISYLKLHSLTGKPKKKKGTRY
jgi:hypothetical protein